MSMPRAPPGTVRGSRSSAPRPTARRIDDVENTTELGLDDLAGHGAASAITPATGAISASGSRRDFSIDARRSRSPPARAACPRVGSAISRPTARVAVTREPAFERSISLIESLLALPHVGNIDRCNRRRDIAKNVALLHPCAQSGKAARGCGKTAADGGLHVPAGIGIGNDPPRKFSDLPVLGVFGDQRPQRKYPLHRLGHKNRPIRKALGALARDGADGDLGLFFLMAVPSCVAGSRAPMSKEGSQQGLPPPPCADRAVRWQRATPRRARAQHEKNRTLVICRRQPLPVELRLRGAWRRLIVSGKTSVVSPP